MGTGSEEPARTVAVSCSGTFHAQARAYGAAGRCSDHRESPDPELGDELDHVGRPVGDGPTGPEVREPEPGTVRGDDAQAEPVGVGLEGPAQEAGPDLPMEEEDRGAGRVAVLGEAQQPPVGQPDRLVLMSFGRHHALPR